MRAPDMAATAHAPTPAPTIHVIATSALVRLTLVATTIVITFELAMTVEDAVSTGDRSSSPEHHHRHRRRRYHCCMESRSSTLDDHCSYCGRSYSKSPWRDTSSKSPRQHLHNSPSRSHERRLTQDALHPAKQQPKVGSLPFKRIQINKAVSLMNVESSNPTNSKPSLS